MLPETIEKKLNEQLNAELYSSYLYLSMSAYFESINLQGFANWMRVQAQEELAHSLKFFDFINNRGGRVELNGVEKPDFEWKDAIHVVESTYAHEKKVTSLINQLVGLCIDERDFATQNFLQWFINEQVEEEATVYLLLERLKMVEGKNPGLFLLDKELQLRQFVPDTTNA